MDSENWGQALEFLQPIWAVRVPEGSHNIVLVRFVLGQAFSMQSGDPGQLPKFKT